MRFQLHVYLDEMDTCWMQSFLTKPGSQWDIDGVVTGDAKLFATKTDGPPPPQVQQVSVVALVLQATANMFTQRAQMARSRSLL